MAQNENTRTEERSILKFDPIVLIRDVIKRWRLIVLAMVVAGMCACIYGTAVYKPTYQTNITYVTYTRSGSTTVYSNMSSAMTVASVFEELLNSSLMRGTILRETGLPSFDGQIYASVISVSFL